MMAKMEGKLLGLLLLSIISVERTASFSIPTAIGRLPKYSGQSRCQLLSTISEKWLCNRCSTIVKSSEIDSDEESKFSDRALGLLVLITVPIAWGTYVPVVRYLYEIQPPVPGFVFSAAYYVVASLTLIGLVSANVGEPDVPQHSDEDAKQIGTIVTTSSLPILGGLELGTYLFLGNSFQILGLKTVPSDRAGFLVQLTTVMVPFVSGVLDGNLQTITAKTWIACLLAFAGVVVMGVDGRDDIGSLSSLIGTFSEGDLFIVMAAFVYTLHVVRLGTYARGTTPFKLGACKATTEAILSISLILFLVSVGGASTETGSTGQLVYAQEAGRDILTFFSTISEKIAYGAIPTSVLLPALGATLWTGWITCAYTISAQSFGQSRLGPTEANLIYSMQPLFTALFAWCLLGETLGPAGAIGGGLILSAVYLAARNVREEREET